MRTDDVLAHEVRHRLDEDAGRDRRWEVTIIGGVVTVEGVFADEAERTVVSVMARTAPGVTDVHLASPAP